MCSWSASWRKSPAGAGVIGGASLKTASLVTQMSRHGVAIAYADLLCLGFGLYINEI